MRSMASYEARTRRFSLRRWTRHEYGRLIDHGFLDEDDPIELLDGLLLVKEPQNSPHRTAVLLLAKTGGGAVGEGWVVPTQKPIIFPTPPPPPSPPAAPPRSEKPH